LVELLDEVSLANEELTRQMWINLLTTEIVGKSVHPEFINILKRLAPDDAKLLMDIASESEAKKQEASVRRYLRQFTPSNPSYVQSMAGLMWAAFYPKSTFNLSLTILNSLQVVENDSGMKVHPGSWCGDQVPVSMSFDSWSA
jgi:hypothetical protein